MSLGAESEVLAELLWQTTWQAAVLALVVLLITTGLRHWITPTWRAALWLLPACRLLLLIVPASALSMFNLFGLASIERGSLEQPGLSQQSDLAVIEFSVAKLGEDHHLTDPHAPALDEQMPGLAIQPSLVSESTLSLNSETPAVELSASWLGSLALVGTWLLGSLIALILWMRSQFLLLRSPGVNCVTCGISVRFTTATLWRALRLPLLA